MPDRALAFAAFVLLAVAPGCVAPGAVVADAPPEAPPPASGAGWASTSFEGAFRGGHLACMHPPLPRQCTFGPAPPPEGGEAVRTDLGGDVLAATVVLAWRPASEDAARLRLSLKGPGQEVLAQVEGPSPLEARLEGVRVPSDDLWVVVSPIPVDAGVTAVYAFPEDQPYRWDMRALVQPAG